MFVPMVLQHSTPTARAHGAVPTATPLQICSKMILQRYFPTGLTVGCGSNFKLDFTSAAAIETYLPCTGSAQDLVLTHGGSNPTEEAEDPTCWNNALVST